MNFCAKQKGKEKIAELLSCERITFQGFLLARLSHFGVSVCEAWVARIDLNPVARETCLTFEKGSSGAMFTIKNALNNVVYLSQYPSYVWVTTQFQISPQLA